MADNPLAEPPPAHGRVQLGDFRDRPGGVAAHELSLFSAPVCNALYPDLPTVARWLGHRDGGALLSKRYFHLLDAHSQTMAARVNL